MYTLDVINVIKSSWNLVRMLFSMKSRPSLKLGHVGSKTRSLGQILEKLVFTPEVTILVVSSWNLVRMYFSMDSRPSSKLGHVGSKTRSLGQILEKPCLHSRCHQFDPIFMKLGQNDDLYEIWAKFETGSCGKSSKFNNAWFYTSTTSRY